MKVIIKKIGKILVHLIPAKVISYLKYDNSVRKKKLPEEYIKDYLRFKENSIFTSIRKSKENYISLIISYYHIIEKGLTMPDTRLGFGKDALRMLINYIKDYKEKFDDTHIQYIEGIRVVNQYIEFHEIKNYEFENDLAEILAEFKREFHSKKSKINTFNKTSYFEFSESNFYSFSNSRHSLRNYDLKEEISIDEINKALKLCENTPSACNRQPNRVYILSNKDEIIKVLNLQGGNRGFGHLVNKLIVITAALSTAAYYTERNQVYVDGGIYLMNLLYSLHFYKIGACALNCSFDLKTDSEIRTILNLSSDEVFIAMISVGYPAKEFSVPCSLRNTYLEYTHYR